MAGKGTGLTPLLHLAIFFPVAPDDFLCYLAGLTRMSLKKFSAIIFLGKPASIAPVQSGAAQHHGAWQPRVFNIYRRDGADMKLLLYTGAAAWWKKSGIGRAIAHQEQAFAAGGLDYTENAKDAYTEIHLNTVFPDSLWMARKARKQGKRVDLSRAFHAEIFAIPL